MKRRTVIQYLVFVSLATLLYASQIPTAQKGIIDLTDIDFTHTQSVDLNGEWEFYWTQLLSPNDFKQSKTADYTYQNIPSIWDNFKINDQFLPEYGYATYRLKIKVRNPDQIWAIKTGEIFTAFRLWINGEEINRSGTVGINKEHSIPHYKPSTISFHVTGNEIELILQISNFHFKDGGFNTPITFGLGTSLTQAREHSLIFNYFVFGSVLIIGLYHLGLSYLNKYNKTSLLFGMFSLIIASRILVTNESYLTAFFSNISWQVHVKMIVLGYSLGFLAFTLFLYQLYKEDFSEKIIRIIRYISGAFALLVLFTPASIYSYLEIYYQLFILITSIYLLVILIKAAKRKRGGAQLILVGFLILFIATINDILYAQYLSSIQSLVPFALFIFIFLQSYIIAKHFSHSVAISKELAIINQELQESNRTKDKFFSIIAHDLRGPIGNLMQFSELASNRDSLSENELNKILNFQKNLAKSTYHLLDNLLNWARLNNDKMAFNPEVIELNAIINESILGIQTLADEKNIQITAHLDKSYQAYADKNMVSFIFRNFLSNAIKFTGENGNISIHLDSDPQNIFIAIKDTGIGISQENIKRILSDSEYFTTTGTNREKGNGLGLKLCKNFIEKNNGTLTIESTINEGTTFRFTLPKIAPQKSL